jgi:hypothetical protein
MNKIYPQFPLYIPTKGRYEYMITSKALTEMGIKHYIVIEPQEIDKYYKYSKGLLSEILPLDMSYKWKYELCDDQGLTKSTGPGPARNFIWDHSIQNGYDWHWTMDDNIKNFLRMHKNRRIKCLSPGYWRAMEDFCLRYDNVAMAGPDYSMFAFSGAAQPPFILNTRIYSCNLIRNDVPFRWRGRYNEDTILSLDMLKSGWCTIQFNAFLQAKMGTQILRGGNTDEFYHKEGEIKSGERYADKGTLAKSQMLVSTHPDVSELVYKYGRIHHKVNYKRFKYNKLIKKPGILISDKPNEYGMVLIEKTTIR